MSVAVAEKFVATFYKRYKGVKVWHDLYAADVKAHRKPSSFRDKKGIPVGASIVRDAYTRRKYVFKEYEAPEWLARSGKTHTFSPTEMKNYPIQGFATGDIVPLMLGEVFYALMKNEVLKNNCLMVNTVHDSLLFDCKKEVAEHAIDFLRNILENTPLYFKKVFGVALPFDKFKVGVSVGSNWLDMKEL